MSGVWMFVTIRPQQNGYDFSDDISQCILYNEMFYILINHSLNAILMKDAITEDPIQHVIMDLNLNGLGFYAIEFVQWPATKAC